MKLSNINNKAQSSPHQIVANIIKNENLNAFELYEYGEFVKNINWLEVDYYCRKARELGLAVISAHSYNGWVIREK